MASMLFLYCPLLELDPEIRRQAINISMCNTTILFLQVHVCDASHVCNDLHVNTHKSIIFQLSKIQKRRHRKSNTN